MLDCWLLVSTAQSAPKRGAPEGRTHSSCFKRGPHKPSDCSCAPCRGRGGQFSVPAAWVACDMWNDMRKACLHGRGEGLSPCTAAARCLAAHVLVFAPWYGSRQRGPCGHEAKLRVGVVEREIAAGSADHFPISPTPDAYRGHSRQGNCSPSGGTGTNVPCRAPQARTSTCNATN